MLRHLKMELKRDQAQQQQLASLACAGRENAPTTTKVSSTKQHSQLSLLDRRLPATPIIDTSSSAAAAAGKAPKRQRGRRSSKPQMEKRRRARINDSLETLKSYVLNDPATLEGLGIDERELEPQLMDWSSSGEPLSSEATGERERALAARILQTSGLIHRHRGRKNPNKLEKADILELAVDYVKRLHARRNQPTAGHPSPAMRELRVSVGGSGLSPKSGLAPLSHASAMLTPPPSSGGSASNCSAASNLLLHAPHPSYQCHPHQPLLSIANQMPIDLSSKRPHEEAPGCWRPWHRAA